MPLWSAYTWKIIPEYKYFINKKANFKGLYTGPYLKYQADISKETYREVQAPGFDEIDYVIRKFQTYGAGATFGFQTYLKKHLVLDFLLGIDVNYATRKIITPPADANPPDKESYEKRGSYPMIYPNGRIAINLGYRF